MFDKSRCLALVEDWLNSLSNDGTERQVASYVEFDEAVSAMETTLFEWEHTVNVAKNIAYELLPEDASKNNLGEVISSHLRDAGRPLSEYRKCFQALFRAYSQASHHFLSQGNSELAEEARKNAQRYGRPEGVPVVSEAVYPGWFARHKRDGERVVAVDYPTGEAVFLADEKEDKSINPLQVKGLPGGVDDVLRSENGWYFIASKGTTVVKTDKDFCESGRFEIDLPPAHIARHFSENGSEFACTQFDDEVHYFDSGFKKIGSLKVAGVTQFRAPSYSGNKLYVFDYDSSGIGFSDVLMVNRKDGEVWCIQSGLDRPMSLAVRQDGTMAIGDFLGIHFVNLGELRKTATVSFEELIADCQDGPYCDEIDFTGSGMDIYVLCLNDFNGRRDIHQRLLRISGSML